MAFRRSPVRSRSGPQNNQQLRASALRCYIRVVGLGRGGRSLGDVAPRAMFDDALNSCLSDPEFIGQDPLKSSLLVALPNYPHLFFRQPSLTGRFPRSSRGRDDDGAVSHGRSPGGVFFSARTIPQAVMCPRDCKCRAASSIAADRTARSVPPGVSRMCRTRSSGRRFV